MRTLLAPGLVLVSILGCGGSDGGGATDDAATEDSALPPNDGGRGDAVADGVTADATADGPRPDGASDSMTAACGDVESYIPAWARDAKPTRELYVSPTGDDANDGSKEHPYKTTAKAFASAAPGVRLNFTTGSFACPPFTADLLASTSAPFVVRAVDGPRTAKFDCGGTGDFFFSHARGVVLDGLEISNTSGHGIQLDSGSGFATKDLSADFVLAHSHVHHTVLAGIKVAQSQRIYVVGNEFDHSGPGRQDVEFVGSDLPVVVGNDAHDSDAFDEVKGGAHGGLIALNRVHDMNPGAGGILVGGDCTGYAFLVDQTADFEAKDLRVWGNVITGADGFAFRIVGCHDCLVANNTYWSPAPKAILRIIHDGFDKGSGTCNDVPLHNANVHVVNNVFAWSSSSLDVIPNNDDPKNVIMDHNLWFAGGTAVSALYSDLPFTGEPGSVYDKDPKLVSPPTDVSLGAGSPARGAGVALADVGATFDRKCPASPPNLGAY